MYLLLHVISQQTTVTDMCMCCGSTTKTPGGTVGGGGRWRRREIWVRSSVTSQRNTVRWRKGSKIYTQKIPCLLNGDFVLLALIQFTWASQVKWAETSGLWYWSSRFSTYFIILTYNNPNAESMIILLCLCRGTTTLLISIIYICMDAFFLHLALFVGSSCPLN